MTGKLRNMASIYLTGADKILLLFRQGGSVVNDVWIGSAGGHFETYEVNDAKACVLREMREELGFTENDIRELSLRYITLRRTQGEIRLNYYFFAELNGNAAKAPSSNEGICRWFAYSELPALNMPYSAGFMMEHYLKTGRRTSDLYVGVADGETVVFTKMPEG